MKMEDAERNAESLRASADVSTGWWRGYGLKLEADARYDIFLLSIASNEGMIGDDE